jgi:gas vesicle protein
MSALTGSSTKIGEVGEDLVREKVSTMNLGSYEVDNKNPNPGYADGTWRYEYADGKIPTITCICEVKNEECLSQRDFEKFCKVDLSAARLLGKNWGVFISLRCRISGKPSVSIDRKHGIPVLWISRSSTDTLSAEKMVEIAFHTIVNVWPLMQAEESGGDTVDGLLWRLSTHMENQREEIERLLKMSNDVERTGQQLVRKAVVMRSGCEGLLKGMQVLCQEDGRICCRDSTEVYNFWEEHGKQLKESIRSYHTSHGRHAQCIKDLRLDEELEKVVASIPHAFKTALDSIKSDIQKEASHKRMMKRKQSHPDSREE